METNCVAFAIHILPENIFEEINVTSVEMNLPYKGSMVLIDLKSDK